MYKKFFFAEPRYESTQNANNIQRSFEPPPPPNGVPRYEGLGGSKSKSSLGILFWSKKMVLQGVAHPISQPEVCCANDPQKGEYTMPAPALDLTTLFEVICKYRR